MSDKILIGNIKGPQGEKGEDGVSPIVSVGTTKTLTAGSNATVTNTGTYPDVVLNFGIPKGDKGDPGSGGGESDHSLLSNLDYENSGHTGFASIAALETKANKEYPTVIPFTTFAEGIATFSTWGANFCIDAFGLVRLAITAAKADGSDFVPGRNLIGYLPAGFWPPELVAISVGLWSSSQESVGVFGEINTNGEISIFRPLSVTHKRASIAVCFQAAQ